LLINLSACAEFRDHPLHAADLALNIEKRSLTNPQLQQFIEKVLAQEIAWPLPAWDLDKLSLAALYYHPDMALARAVAETVDAANITAAQRPNPTLNATPSYLTHLATAVAPWYAVSTLNIPIETAGKRGFRMDKAQQLTEAARLRIVDAAWTVRGRLRLAWLEAFAAQEAERLAQQQLGLQQAVTSRLEQQLAAGEISRQELLRSQLQLNQAQLNAYTAQKRQAESRVQLATALGVPVEALTEISLDFNQLAQAPALDNIPVAKLREIALQQRPDILAALADYAAAQAALQLEIANQYPNIQANPGYAWELGENLWSLGASVQLPIFHQNQGLIAEAQAKRRELAVRFTALQAKIIGDIDRVHAGFSAMLAKQQQAAQQKSLQQENLLAIQGQFKAGEIDHLALLAAEMEAAIAERARLDVFLETQQALNNLEDSLRTPINSTFTTSIFDNSAARNILQ
jgi:outer membrane protein TolC